MKKSRNNNLRESIARIESKCDRILAEMMVIRHSKRADLAIERMGQLAWEMREKSIADYEKARQRYGDR